MYVISKKAKILHNKGYEDTFSPVSEINKIKYRFILCIIHKIFSFVLHKHKMLFLH